MNFLRFYVKDHNSEFPWVIESSHESLWVSMSHYDSLWVCIICESLWIFVSLYESPLVTLSQWVAMSLCTVLQKFSKCEVKAAWCGNLLILLPLKFYVKSNFGELKGSKIWFLAILEGLKFWFLINLCNCSMLTMTKIQSLKSLEL